MWEVIIPAAASVIGGALGSAGQANANVSNERIAREQMEWQAHMSNTAHQREKTDLIAAGLNPLLTANAGASTPPGATATMENTMEPIAASARELGQMAIQMQKQKEEIALMKKQGALNDAQKRKTNIEADVAKKDIPKAEITNEIYQLIKPAIEKTKGMFQDAAQKQPSKQIEDYMKKFHDRQTGDDKKIQKAKDAFTFKGFRP